MSLHQYMWFTQILPFKLFLFVISKQRTRITIFFLITVSNFFFCPEIIERSWFKSQKIVNKMHTFGSLNRLFGWLMEIIDFLPSLVTMCILFAEQWEHKQHRNHHRSAKCQTNDNTVGYLYTRAQFLSVSHWKTKQFGKCVCSYGNSQIETKHNQAQHSNMNISVRRRP